MIEDQEITVFGGYLEVNFQFSWSKLGSGGMGVEGTGSCFGKSD